MLKIIQNFRAAWKSARWRRALLIAVVSDILSFALVLIPPVQWGVDAATAILMFVALGFRWGLLGALVVEAIPAIQVFPAWTLVVLALAGTDNKNRTKKIVIKMKNKFGFRMKTNLPGFLLLISLLVFNINGSAQSAKPELPKEKQTSLALYVTAAEAYGKWKTEPEKVKILDVRTPEEYMYIGHAAMAWNIPLLFQTYNWDEDKKHFSMKPNPDFISMVKKAFQPDDIILVTCRSGGRSAMAVNQLAGAGYKNVYNITDGMEGDAITDVESLFVGQRLKNGWKNSGLPWTYKIDPKLMLISESK